VSMTNESFYINFPSKATPVWGRVAPTNGPAEGWQGRSFGPGTLKKPYANCNVYA
jgi:hypothetical protein